MKVYEIISEYFELIVNFLVMIVEIIGIVILMVAVINALIGLIKRHSHAKLQLAEGLALAIEFKMGAEILKTVIVHDWNELLILGAVILLRAAMTFLIQWEIKTERKNGNITDEMLHDIKTPLTQDLNKKPFFKRNKKGAENENKEDKTSENQSEIK